MAAGLELATHRANSGLGDAGEYRPAQMGTSRNRKGELPAAGSERMVKG